MTLLRSLMPGAWAWPESVQLSPSDVCNSRCTVCWLHGPDAAPGGRNVDAAMFHDVKPSIMDFDVYRNILGELSAMRPFAIRHRGRRRPMHITFCGLGEPTLNPRVEDMMELAGRHGFPSALITNGSRLTPDMLGRIERRDLTIMVSLNAHDAKSHSACSGIEADRFSSLVETVRTYTSRPGRLMPFTLSFVVGACNVDHVGEMARLGADMLGPGDRAFFYPEWTPSLVQSGTVREEQLSELVSVIPYAKAVLDGAGVKHNLDVLPGVLHALSVSSERDAPTKAVLLERSCSLVRGFFVVLADGRVKPCCFSGFLYGDASREPLRRIWRSARARRFRAAAESIASHGGELPNSNCFSCGHFLDAPYFIERCRRGMAVLTQP